ncbi:MAG: hypothetical protein UIT84_06710, partial [Lachnospiraceae bacterium]
LSKDRFLLASFDRDVLTNKRKEKMLDPIEITMEAVKTFSDPHYDNAAKNLFLYPEILAPILANVVPEYQGINAEQVKKLGDMDGMCRYINMRKNKKLAKGVNQVMTLSQSIFSRGVQEGVEKGLVEGEAKGLAKGEIKGIAKGKAQGITEGEARNFIFSVKTLMKNTKKSKEEVLAMLGKTNQDYINALQILSDNN